MLSAGLPVVVTWRPAQTVLLLVQGMDVAAIAKEGRIAYLYAIADREFGPLNLQLRPGRQRAPVSGKTKKPGRTPRHRLHPHRRVPHLFAAG